MRTICLSKNWNRFGFFGCGRVLFLFLLVSACFTPSLPADQAGQAFPPDITKTSGGACPDKEELVKKSRTLRMPFIANNGQVNEQVRFYAKTFGGTVFVTKEGEIVYSLPEGRGRDVPDGASPSQSQHDAGEQGEKAVSGWQGQAPFVRAESEFVVANAYSPLLHTGNANCPPDRVFANALLSAYLPGLQKRMTRRVISTSSTPPNYNLHQKSETQNQQSPMRSLALKEQLICGNIDEIKGGAQSITTVSYFKGNNPSKWKSNISTCEIVDMGEVYRGIFLRLKAYGNNVEKLFTVMPDANPDAIKIWLSGAKDLRVNEDGQLEAETSLGPVKFTKPIAYQEIDGKRVAVAVEYHIQKSGIDTLEGSGVSGQGIGGEFETRNPKLTYGFTVASYDKTKDLIIDPLLASTFLGGNSGYYGGDYGNVLSLDANGNVYVAGTTSSNDFPTTSGAYDTSFNSGDYSEVFVSKLNSELTSLLASTFLGGTGSEECKSLALDTSGNVYVAGTTNSSTFPTTSGAYDTSYNGGDYSGDVFISKLNSGLTELLASTFLGGGVDEVGNALALDTSGNVYMTGDTNSSDFPVTSGAYDTGANGFTDLFVSKLDSNLTSLLASTYMGTAEYDYGQALAIDTSGNVYVAGMTNSLDFPVTSGAYNTSYSGNTDVFISKLNNGLTSLLASTFLGGHDVDSGYSLAFNTSGNVYVTGVTDSSDFPVTSGAYNTSYNGAADAFVSKLNSGLTSLLASTFLGGSIDWDAGNSIAIDGGGNVFVLGSTMSSDFPTTSGAYDITFNGAFSTVDVFISKLNGGLTSLLASTFLGGHAFDSGESLALDTSGNVYVTGATGSNNFPTTSGVYDTSFNGGGVYPYDAFISKLDGNLSATDDCVAESIAAAPGELTLGKNGSGDVTVTVSGAGKCPAAGVTVKATINGKGKQRISVAPSSQETDANGQAMFTISAKDKKGTAVLKFKASGLSKVATVRAKVR